MPRCTSWFIKYLFTICNTFDYDFKMTKIIFSRKGFDSSTGGMPSYKRNETLISFPIPSQKNTLTTYNDCRLGKYVKELSNNKIQPTDTCHFDPNLDYGEFGQVGAAQTHLQNNKVKVYEDDLTDIYNSRTFCLYEDIEKIKENGLAKGGSLDNAIVVKDDKVLNDQGLRNDKEFVNHKILDCIGDLYTSGYRIVASIVCSQGGHYLTNQLLRKVFKDQKNFSIVEIKEKNLPHTLINRTLLRNIA